MAAGGRGGDAVTALHHVLSALAVLGVGVVYGTDVFAAVVLRPAFAKVGDAVLTEAAGFVHRYGDRRLPVPGAGGLVLTALAAVAAVLRGSVAAAVLDLAAVVLLLGWLVIYTRVSAPVNRAMTEAAEAGETLADVRALQRRWDGVIIARVALQGAALLALVAGIAV